ncbi:carbohydrate kinase family protein [Marinobacter sp. JSM 1782161]|uniref:carbohydrate kinase family protein n=1 Tax=Marinobacter sp. JSM 1782161 TaxID=2685906 RepID=UPI0014036B7B|nr:carbohydrate kinase family protein [Marinobacter sp. JSM 1782161]
MQEAILIIGGASLDTIVQLDALPQPVPQTIWPRRSYRALGSTGAGKALNLVGLEQRVTLHTLLGRDEAGRTIRDALEATGLTLLVEETDAPTEQHVNLMDPHGHRISLFIQPPATPDRVDWAAVRAAMTRCPLVVVNILDYARPALELARNSGTPIWTDLHDYDGRNPHHQAFIDAADVIFLSSDNLPDYRAFMRAQMDQGKSMVVCTHGSQGATLLDRDGRWLEQPAFAVPQVVDTNGAGDAFFSGFLYGHLRGDSPARCLQLAAACGALTVQSTGLAGETLSPATLDAVIAGHR